MNVGVLNTLRSLGVSRVPGTYGARHPSARLRNRDPDLRRPVVDQPLAVALLDPDVEGGWVDPASLLRRQQHLQHDTARRDLVWREAGPLQPRRREVLDVDVAGEPLLLGAPAVPLQVG